MAKFLRSASICFSAGCVGGLANSVALWLGGQYGLTALLGVRLAPQLSPAWLYPRLVWGGLWGLLFLLPLLPRKWVTRGLVLSLGPSLVQLFYVFPFQADQGQLGLGLGTLTPLVVLLVNAIWGLVTAAWADMAK